MSTHKNKSMSRITRISVLPDGEPIFSELCTHVSIEDDAAGEYVEVSQNGVLGEDYSSKISIDPSEWQVIKEAIEKMVGFCKENNDSK